MDKLTLYISKTILGAILLVLTLFIGLEFIFSMVNELRFIGKGDYHTTNALSYIFLSLPQLLSQTFPMSALIGTLLGLGVLASRSELIVMRAAGWSSGDIIRAVLKLAAVLALATWLLGEWAAPLTEKLAHDQKATALSGGQALRTVNGTWMRDGNDFIHIHSLHAGGHLEGVTRYEFDENGELRKATFARFADYVGDHWILHDIRESIFTNESMKQRSIAEQDWYSHIEPQILNIVGVKDLDELSVKELWQTMRYRQANGLDAKPYQLAFWQKVVRPLATLVMMFLAIPFIFGPLRSATMGLRMLFGALIGFAFYTFNQLFGPLTLVYHIPPLVGALFPTVLFFIIGIVTLKKTQQA